MRHQTHGRLELWISENGEVHSRKETQELKEKGIQIITFTLFSSLPKD